VERDSEHYFVRLSQFEERLREWVGTSGGAGGVQREVANKLSEWFDAGLRDWDISRDAPYFGFEIPDAPGKFFYVWLDAPIGYMASFANLCARRPDLDFDEYWRAGARTELYHFIGKDIAYFHTLFWPACLHGGGFRMPSAVFCHGFLTVNGEKMSKRRGTFIQARTYADHLDPEYLRYYFACKLGDGIDDMDLNLEDFVARVNSDLVGKVVNIASRCARLLQGISEGRLAGRLHEPALFERFARARDAIAGWYETREYGRAMREVMALADLANRYIDEHKPWVAAREPEGRAEAHAVCSTGIELFRLLAGFLKPVLPGTVARAEGFLGVPPLAWSDLSQPLCAAGEHRINRFEPLLTRVEPGRVDAMVEASRER
jgi:methionyl-tRNA synthetase